MIRRSWAPTSFPNRIEPNIHDYFDQLHPTENPICIIPSQHSVLFCAVPPPPNHNFSSLSVFDLVFFCFRSVRVSFRLFNFLSVLWSKFIQKKSEICVFPRVFQFFPTGKSFPGFVFFLSPIFSPTQKILNLLNCFDKENCNYWREKKARFSSPFERGIKNHFLSHKDAVIFFWEVSWNYCQNIIIQRFTSSHN